MSQLSADASHGHAAHHESFPELRAENITLAKGTGSGLANVLLGLGVIALAVGVAGGIASNHTLHALAAYHVAAVSVLAMSLGALFFVMVFHLTNAGWASTIRRQYENVATLVPIAALMVLVGIAADYFLGKGKSQQLFSWMHEHTHENYLLQKKMPFLNMGFFIVRSLVYVGLWTFLSQRFFRWSTEQDKTGDVSISARARFTSAWGILLFALSVAFAAFDWIMSIDFTFFSTMWGVYYFAGSAYSGTALMIIVLTRLMKAGKLQGVVTGEHLHDVGKLLFAFTVFWAYIAFSQYFLIWYSHIPEETAFYLARIPFPKSPGAPITPNNWVYVGAMLCIAHFGLPFLILLFRKVKQTPVLIATMAVWSIGAHVIDMFWLVRPMVYVGTDAPDKIGISGLWIDALAIVGVFGIFGSLVVRRVSASQLVAAKDPYIGEAMHHKNYV